MTTAYITHPDCLRHDMGAGHPECPARLNAIGEQMRESGMLGELHCLEAPLAQAADLKRVHRPAYVDMIFDNAPTAGHVQLDPDTAMNPHSLSAARRAAGAGLLAVDEVMAGRSANAFCAVRPCGHHATQARSMGFCIFNNIAVAAAYAIESKGQKLVLWGDLMHVASVQFGQPQITIAFDSDSKAAAVQRKKAYADAAKGGFLVAGAHLPFPGIGHLRAEGKGYAWVPIDYNTIR